MKEKTFYKALIEFSQDPEKAKKCLSDKRLTITEKKILDGYLKIRNNQNIEVMELFHADTLSDSLFVESQRLLLMGVASNNLSQYKQAENYILASIKILKNLDTHYFHFFACFNLFWIYTNLNETERMGKILSEMSKIPSDSNKQLTRLLRCQFCFYQMTEKNDEALGALKKLESMRSSFSESDIIQFLTDKFIFYIQIEDFRNSYKVLDDMKNYRKFHVPENFRFMKKMLNHLTKGSPIYAYHQDFEKMPILLHEIKFIQSLEENKLDEARKHWNELAEISPNTYRKEFQYNGLKCLFSLCLEKHRHQLAAPIKIEIAENASKIDVLITLLSNSKTPLSAGLIHEVVWGRDVESKDDLMKLARLVFRAKKERNISIESRKGTYHIKQVASEKAS